MTKLCVCMSLSCIYYRGGPGVPFALCKDRYASTSFDVGLLLSSAQPPVGRKFVHNHGILSAGSSPWLFITVLDSVRFIKHALERIAWVYHFRPVIGALLISAIDNLNENFDKTSGERKGVIPLLLVVLFWWHTPYTSWSTSRSLVSGVDIFLSIQFVLVTASSYHRVLMKMW